MLGRFGKKILDSEGGEGWMEKNCGVNMGIFFGRKNEHKRVVRVNNNAV